MAKNVVHLPNKRTYPTTDADEVVRPYRLWHAEAKTTLRWRCYSILKHAHDNALIEVRWLKGDEPGQTIEVFDITNGRLHGQYVRRADRIDFYGPMRLDSEGNVIQSSTPKKSQAA